MRSQSGMHPGLCRLGQARPCPRWACLPRSWPPPGCARSVRPERRPQCAMAVYPETADAIVPNSIGPACDKLSEWCARRRGKGVAIELPCTLPQRREEGGVKSLASLNESVRGTFAPAREVKGVVAPVPGTGVKAYTAQLFGRLRVFLAATGTNHDDARGRLRFSDAIVAHANRSEWLRRECIASRIGSILPNGRNRHRARTACPSDYSAY